MFEGRKVLLPDATPKGLVAHYTFDEIKVLDSSGNSNHAKYAIPAGPGVGGKGASAMFNGFDSVEVPHSPSFDSKVFSVSFWMYLYKDPAASVRHGAKWCPILQKGGNKDEQVHFFCYCYCYCYRDFYLLSYYFCS